MDTMTRPRVLSATTLINEPVHNTRDERIGKIEDYMVDLQGGCIEYAVLSFGGFLGIGAKLFAIPWNSMQLDTQRHQWVLDVTEERLKQAPGFDKDNWPDLTDTDYRNTIQAFWGANTQSGYPGIHGREGSGGQGGMGGSGMSGGQGGMGSSGMGTSGQSGMGSSGMGSSGQSGQSEYDKGPGLEGGSVRMEGDEDKGYGSGGSSSGSGSGGY